MALRAVTLDAAGTLVEVAEPVGATYARIAAEHGIAVTPVDLERGFRTAFAAAPPLAFPGGSPTRLGEHERAWWYAVVRRAFGRGAAASTFDACFGELYAHYARPAAWRVLPEVAGALADLRARGLRLAVVSNFDGRLPGLLAGLGLAELVDAIVHSTAVGAAKPDPAIFHAALERLGACPDEALHAGDGLLEDVEGARGAGLAAVLVDRTGRAAEPPAGVPTIAGLDELPARLGLPPRCASI
jgi:putative hydrolase of the HAD superfamily